ncbi:unnamed protein product, partial [Rotaria socialis]
GLNASGRQDIDDCVVMQQKQDDDSTSDEEDLLHTRVKRHNR